ncbi:MAG: hypothetical protein AB8I69_17260 [Anaerolineae bacterium]|jgi:hypothetical protein
MKTRIPILIAIVALLLVGSIALAQSSEPPAGYAVEQGTASGGSYHLTSLSWHASGGASGGGYRLLEPASPSGGNQCCCTFLPCALHNH